MTATITLHQAPRPHRHQVDPARRRPSEATYRRRRLAVGGVTAVMAAVAILATFDVLADSGSVPASAAESRPALERLTITAQPGDTLWAIAERYHGDVSLSRYVDKLVDLNGGASIRAGQSIILP